MGSGVSKLYEGAEPLINTSHLKEMREKGLKFTEEDLVMTVKDCEGNLIWLEKGNNTAGLTHILFGNDKTTGHEKDFKKAFGVEAKQIPTFIKTIISNEKIISIKQRALPDGKTGIEKIFFVDGKYYLLVGVGTNGFIVSAYPVEIINN